MDQEELIRLGFRWTRATPIVLNDGRHATVTPSASIPPVRTCPIPVNMRGRLVFIR